MLFRKIDFTRYLYNLLRPNYAVAHKEIAYPDMPYCGGSRLGNYFRWLYAITQELVIPWEFYDEMRRERFMVAACRPILGQMENVFNYLWGVNGTHGSYGIISLTDEIQGVYLAYDETAPRADWVYLPYSDEPAPSAEELKYFPWEGAISNMTIVNIPESLANDTLEFEQFVAYLNAVVPYSIRFKIISYS